jgi:hypothetical protein
MSSFLTDGLEMETAIPSSPAEVMASISPTHLTPPAGSNTLCLSVMLLRQRHCIRISGFSCLAKQQRAFFRVRAILKPLSGFECHAGIKASVFELPQFTNDPGFRGYMPHSLPRRQARQVGRVAPADGCTALTNHEREIAGIEEKGYSADSENTPKCFGMLTESWFLFMMTN